MRNSKIHISILSMVLSLILYIPIVQSETSMSVVDDAIQNLDDKTRSYYELNSQNITELKKAAYDTSRPTKERTAALDELDFRFHILSVGVARDLVGDGDVGVATAAIELLSASIAMSDFHSLLAGKDLSPNQIVVKQSHEKTRSVLRNALEDPRPSVRTLAAEILASLSDEQALEMIQTGVRNGLYTARQAVNYFGLSDSKVGGKFILPYLDSESTDAQLSAVGYLGAYESFQHEVRDNVFLNPNAKPDVRAESANILGKYDKGFTLYADEVTSDPVVPLNVYTNTVNSYIEQKGKEGDWTSEEKAAVQSSINKDEMFNPGVDLSAVSGRLNQGF